MKIVIIHLSDLHIMEKTDLTPKCGSICNLITSEYRNSDKIFLVVTGDIAYTGSEAEYNSAHKFIGVIKNLIEKELSPKKITLILAPGNHDCNFKSDSQIRRLSIENVNYRTIGNDNSVFETSLVVQSEFWKFYSKYNAIPQNKIYYKIIETIDNFKICFHCFNTAWMSQQDEVPGTIFYPVKRIESLANDNTCDIDISVYHHPLNWFNPNTEINNKLEFQSFLDNISNFQLIGHEHQSYVEKRDNYDNGTSTLNFNGGIFNNNKPDFNSAFQILEIEIPSKEGEIKRLVWNKDIFIHEKVNPFKLDGEKNRNFIVKKEFNDLIEEVKIPLSINRATTKLSQLYIFPDIEMLEFDQSHLEDYLDSESLIKNESHKQCIIVGDGQSGKSSLIYMLFRRYYAMGFYPLIINGLDIDKIDYNIILKKAFNTIYSDSETDFDRYKQLDKNKKVLLIDDFHLFRINDKLAFALIKDVSEIFLQTILTVDNAYSLIPQLNAELDIFHFFSIKPLGYKKRNDLIRQYHILKENPLVRDDESLLLKTRETFDQVRQVLGDRIIPSYPIFIISIIQALDYKPVNLNETSYGYCYQTLLHYALVSGAKLPNDELDSYINYLKELAFHFHEKEMEEIDENSFQLFHKTYESNYIIKDFESVKKILLKSKILKKDDGVYTFGYKYILYFLIAKFISEIITTTKGQDHIKRLFQNMHIDKNANILVFITHHSKDVSFIEESLFSSMIPFEGIQEITLEKADPYYKLLQEIARELSNDIIEINKKPEEERDKQLQEQDEYSRKSEQNQVSDKAQNEEIDEMVMSFYNAFRSIEIVGQIIKNRKGSLSKPKLLELITELYKLGFRTIGFLGGMFGDMKSDLTITLMERIGDSDTKHKIEQRINLFTQVLSLQACLGIFLKLVFSIGVKELKDQYKVVAEDIGSPAAKLVSFSINSYYNEVSANEIKILAKELDISVHIDPLKME